MGASPREAQKVREKESEEIVCDGSTGKIIEDIKQLSQKENSLGNKR